MKMLRFNVKGMHCKSCEIVIDDAVENLKGISSVISDHRKGTVLVQFDEKTISADKIAGIIKKEGFEV